MNYEQALQHLSRLLHDPYARDEDIEDVFLELMGNELIDIGIEHFRKRGKGTLLFDLRGKFGWRKGDMPTMYYLTLDDFVEAGGDAEFLEDEIQQYNPQNQVPVIFVYDYRKSGKVVSKDWGLRATAS
jgi:hypothetical protein